MPMSNPWSLCAKQYTYPDTNAAKWLRANPNHPDALAIQAQIVNVPQVLWVGPNPGRAWLAAYLKGASDQGALPMLGLYAIPDRDLGGYSAGGYSTAAEYKTYVNTIISVVGSAQCVVIIEPDSLLHCVSQKNRDLVQERLALLQWTVDAFSKGCHNTATYLDGADAYYQGPSTMAPLLNEAGVGIASGFFVNASQFTSTAYCQGWATATNAILGGWGIEPRQVVIDVSRNGMGRPPQTYIDAHSATWWCNPPAKLGTSPTMTGLVRLKAPGESDGLAGIVTGVPSGAFDPRLAMALINGAVTA